jgi:hypothetical protein
VARRVQRGKEQSFALKLILHPLPFFRTPGVINGEVLDYTRPVERNVTGQVYLTETAATKKPVDAIPPLLAKQRAGQQGIDQLRAAGMAIPGYGPRIGSASNTEPWRIVHVPARPSMAHQAGHPAPEFFAFEAQQANELRNNRAACAPCRQSDDTIERTNRRGA